MQNKQSSTPATQRRLHREKKRLRGKAPQPSDLKIRPARKLCTRTPSLDRAGKPTRCLALGYVEIGDQSFCRDCFDTFKETRK